VGTDTPPRPVGRRPSPWVPTTPPRAKPFCAKAKGLCTRHIIFFKKNYSLIPLTHTHLPVLSKVKKQPLTIYRLTSAIHVVTLHPQTKQNLLTMQNSIYHKHQLHLATVGPCQGAAAADTSLSLDKKHHKRCRDARPVRPSTRRRIYLLHNTLRRQWSSPTNATSEDFDISEISLSRHKKSPTRGSAAALAARSQATRSTTLPATTKSAVG
jgi:hypothetical protein